MAVCEICGNDFEKKNNSKTCSKTCSKELTRIRNASYETGPRILSKVTKEKNNERAKKYYKDHKEEILKARKEKKNEERK